MYNSYVIVAICTMEFGDFVTNWQQYGLIVSFIA